MKIHSTAHTDVGRQRDNNEDFFLIDASLGLYVVCDGMGGHNSGEVASKVAATTVQEMVAKHQTELASLDVTGDPMAYSEVINWAKNAVLRSCRRVYNQANTQPALRGMGTTLTMVWIVGHKAVIAHVGDSRLYLQRQGQLYKLSSDHTLVTELIHRGALTPEQAESHPYRSVLTRAIGQQSSVQVDALLFDVLPQDTFLLCSDGLYSSFAEADELATLLQRDDLDSLSQHLVQVANQRDGSDNITAVLLRAESEALHVQEDIKRSQDVLRQLDVLQQVYMFQHLEMKELVHILNMARTQEEAGGKVLLKEGGSSDQLYLILQGQLAVTRGGQALASLGPGDHFGDMAMLNQRPRNATITTQTPTRLLVLEREPFNEMLRAQPRLGVKMLWNLAQSLSLRLEDVTAQSYGPIKPISEKEKLPPPF